VAVASTKPALTERGEATRRKLLDAAAEVFGQVPYQEGSIVKITQAAGVAHGTFYLYFSSKQEIFEEVVADLNRQVRQAMARASARGRNRREAERLGFRAYFRFTAEHPALYRVIRQAEFVAPGSLRMHYERIVEGYVQGLRQAMTSGEVVRADPEVLAWCLMGVGELVGMRWALWEDSRGVTPRVFSTCMSFVERGLGIGSRENGA
jgi:AcrR family transcriptional regulator